MADTFDDLLREVGIARPAWEGLSNQRPRRPLPRTMRPPAQRLNDPRLSHASRLAASLEAAQIRDMPLDRMIMESSRAGEEQRRQYMQELRDMLRTGRAPQAIRDLPGDLTGLNALSRGANAFASGDAQTGAMETLGGVLALGTLGLGGRVVAPRAVPRLPAPEPATRLPVNATRPLGRARDGSVMPVAPSQPFRNSLRGGSEDLMTASRAPGFPGGPRQNGPTR